MIKCRTDAGRRLDTKVGSGRSGKSKAGKSKGQRVLIVMNRRGITSPMSVYPEDARKFALELLRVADECDPK